MTIRNMYNFLTFCLYGTTFVVIGSLVFTIVLYIVQEPLLSSWPVSLSGTDIETPSSENVANSSFVLINQGFLSVTTTTLLAAFVRIFSILLTGLLTIGIIWHLRGVVSHIKTHRPFNHFSLKHLKISGYLFMLLPLWLFIEVFIRFYLSIPNATLVAKFKVFYIRYSAETGEFLNIYPDLNYEFFIVGAFIIVLAQSFKVGIELQTDKDEII